MPIISFLIVSIIIQYISSQDYCDPDAYCSDCEYCGFDTNDFCSCDFYNSFCLNEDQSEYFDSKFLLNYDGCLSSNAENNLICGPSYVSIKNGVTTTIAYDSTYTKNFYCYYYFTGSDYDNEVTFTIYSEGYQEFYIYFVIYPRDSARDLSVIPSSSFANTNKY